MRPLLLVALLGLSAPVAAEEQPPDDRATSFERVQGPTRESVPGGTLLVAAYGVIWVLLLGFVGLQWRKTRRLETEVDRLTKALRDKTSGTRE